MRAVSLLSIQEHPQGVLGLSISAMTSHKDLWQCYFTDFIAHKLKLVNPSDAPQEGDIAHQILHTYFEQLHDKEMPQKIVELHSHASIKHLFLSQMATNLRPLNKIERVSTVWRVLSVG